MDYGSHLKKSGVRNNDRSKHYVKQSKFEGSLRQLRSEILRELHQSGRFNLPPKNKGGDARLSLALKGLERDGLLKKKKEVADA